MSMRNLKRIKGIEVLLQKLPKEYQYWHMFGHIVSLNFERSFDYESTFKEVACITMILTDANEKYKIKMCLTDVSGNVNFDVVNGFFSGLHIEDNSYNDGWEKEKAFVLESFEQDIEFMIFCDSICVELIEC